MVFDRFIDTGGEIALPFPVGKGEFEVLDGIIAPAFPVVFIDRPRFISSDEIFKPLCDLEIGIGFLKTSCFFGF